MDGVALKQAVKAWASAPDAEKAARFTSTEAVRWLEWGVRSYQNFALGLAFLVRGRGLLTAGVSRPIAYLMGSPVPPTWCRAGVVGSEGFSRTETDCNRGGPRPGPRVNDLAGRGRLADAGLGATVTW